MRKPSKSYRTVFGPSFIGVRDSLMGASVGILGSEILLRPASATFGIMGTSKGLDLVPIGDVARM